MLSLIPSMANPDAAQNVDQLTYERQDLFDYGPNLKKLEQNCPLAQPSKITGSNTTFLQALGQLDLLPLEILQTILQLLDLYTLTLMQSINRRSKLLVDSLPQHREIITHAPNALRAILSTGVAPHFTIRHLSGALRAQKCCECGSFGAYLHLLDCRRYCWLCVAEVRNTLPLPQKAATILFALTADILRQLPCIQRLPGRYSPDRFQGDTHARDSPLVSWKAARVAGLKLHGSREAMEVQSFARYKSDELAAGRPELRFLTIRWQEYNRNRRYLGGPHNKCCSPHRLMASIRFPTLDISNGTLEWGLSCKGCRDGSSNDDESRDWHALYTKRGYLVHYEQCKWSKCSLKTYSLPKLDIS